MKTTLKSLLFALPACLAVASTVNASDADGKSGMYAVTITNLTRGQTFTPVMVASHKRGQPLFTPGNPASPELATVAESGNTQPLSDKLLDSGVAFDTASSGALLGPGESVTVKVRTTKGYRYVSVVSMLIPTNDAFFAVNGVRGPGKHTVKSVASPVYDAGSEVNDELCISIPGPVCGGAAISPEDGEGYVHIHAGIHGIGDLAPATYDWRNPAAQISIARIR